MITDRKPKAQFEDYLRALGYLFIAGWAVTFAVFPSIAYANSLLDITIRTIWMFVVATGALLAFFGAVLRIDIKMELPGIIFLLLGPALYTVTRIFYIVAPLDIPGVTGLNSTPQAIYAFLPVLLLLPRLYSLYVESQRLKRINTPSKGK